MTETNEIETKKTIEKISGTKSWFFEKIKWTKLQLDLQKRRIKIKKLEMKEETSKLIPQKYKVS